MAHLPKRLRRGRQTLIRTDSGGGTHAFLDWLSQPGRWLSYSVGMTITDALHQAVLKIPKKAWTPAYDAGGTERPGGWVAEITDIPDLSTWPKRMRLVARKERPHPGAQLRFTDLDGLRLTCFATNTQRRPARRPRTPSPQTGSLRGPHPKRPRHRPAQPAPHDTARNRIWLEILSLALDLLAWMAMLAVTGRIRFWEPNKLRLRLFSAAAQLVNTGRRRWLRLPVRWPWTAVISHAIVRLHALPNPG
ncbi:transposase [Streptomyces sp. NPDC057798]|uniref:transposase n=1 Tax=Streptomyces sp. NPDC057798 TaxID=3346252 RepID=UPI0036A3ADF4